MVSRNTFNENFKELSSQLTKVEDDIANARKYYNGTVRIFNDKVQMFPSNIIAGIFGYKIKKIESLKLYDGALRRFPHPRSEENIKALATYRACQSKLNYAESFMVAFEREN